MKSQCLVIFSPALLFFAPLPSDGAGRGNVSNQLYLSPCRNDLHAKSAHHLSLSQQEARHLGVIHLNPLFSHSLFEQNKQLCRYPIEYMCTNCGALYDVPPEICHDCGNTVFILAC